MQYECSSSIRLLSLNRHNFDFSATAERNLTILDRKQRPKFETKEELNVLYQVCVFRADFGKQDSRPGLRLTETFFTSSTGMPTLCFSGRSENKDDRWLMHFRHHLCNRLTEFDEM